MQKATDPVTGALNDFLDGMTKVVEQTQTTNAPLPDALLLRMTYALRSANSVGLPIIVGAIEDAATEIILMHAENYRLRGAVKNAHEHGGKHPRI